MEIVLKTVKGLSVALCLPADTTVGSLKEVAAGHLKKRADRIKLCCKGKMLERDGARLHEDCGIHSGAVVIAVVSRKRQASRSSDEAGRYLLDAEVQRRRRGDDTLCAVEPRHLNGHKARPAAARRNDEHSLCIPVICISYAYLPIHSLNIKHCRERKIWITLRDCKLHHATLFVVRRCSIFATCITVVSRTSPFQL